MKIKDLVFSFAGTIVRVAILIIAAYVIVGAGKKAYDFGFRIFTEEPMAQPPGREVSVTVTGDDSESDVATMLEEKGLIRDALLFRIQKKLSVYKGKIDPGTYALNTCMNTDEMLEILVGPVEDDGESEDSSAEDDVDNVDVLNPETDDMTGLETGGVLSEEAAEEDAYAGEGDTIEITEDGEESESTEEENNE